MLNIVNTFAPGKAAVHRISQFYKGGTYVSASDAGVANIPTAGTIAFAGFRGAGKASSNTYYSPRMWLRASDLSSLAHDATVATWTGNNSTHTATGYTTSGSTLPLFKKTTETYPFVRLGTGITNNYSGNHFDFGAQTFNIATNAGFTCVANFRFYGTASAWERLICFGRGANNDNVVVTRWDATTSSGLSYRNGVSSSPDIQIGTFSQNTWQTVAYRFKSNEVAVFQNGTKSTNTSSMPALTNKSWLNTFIGKSEWGNPYANLDLREIMIYDKGLTDTETNDVISYMNNKYV